MERPLALVVDTDPAVRATITRTLRESGLEAVEAGGRPEAAETLRSRPVRLVVAGSAQGLADQAGRSAVSIELLDTRDPGRMRAALEGGADDVLGKPVSEEEVRLAAARVRRRLDEAAEIEALREETRLRTGFDRLVGRSEAMQRLRDRLERLAPAEGGVLVVGEPGSGRETAARTLHALSPRAGRRFVKVDGEAGGAEEDPAALLRDAEGGTLYLHQGDALPVPFQERLARALSEGIRREGGNGAPTGRADVRLVISAGRDPQRLDPTLHGKVNATVEVPTLRSRPEDIPLLARHIVDTIRRMNDLGPLRLSHEASEAIAAHTWPGNVRELWHALEQAVILAQDGTIRPRDLPEGLRRGEAGRPGERPRGGDPGRFRERKRVVVEAFERAYLQDLLRMHGGNVTAAAAHAGMLRSALQRLLRKYALRSADYRPSRTPSAAAESA